MIARTAAALLFVTCAYVRADTEAPPVPVTFASEYGFRVFFEMLPGTNTGAGRLGAQTGEGTAYRLDEFGVRHVLYRTKGWYSHQVIVSRDGRNLVRLGPWPRGVAPEINHLGLAFYRDGALLKTYSTLELLRDPLKVRRSVSHYFWLARFRDVPGSIMRPGPLWFDESDQFYAATIDGWVHVFDASTGKIVRQYKRRGQQ